MKEIISFYIKTELKESIDDKRGDVPRSKYITKILENFIKDSKNKSLPVDNSLPTGYQQAIGIARGEN
jgi:hypothetical protein